MNTDKIKHMIWQRSNIALALAVAACTARCALAAPPPRLQLAVPDGRARGVAALRRWHEEARLAAENEARRKGWPLGWESPDGNVARLVALRHDGMPRYLATVNERAAISLATDLVRATAPFNVTGATMRIGIWDEGLPRPTHQELTGRVDVGDDASSLSKHSTHVAGTLAAAGVDNAARGMAPAARLYACDWSNDTAEMWTMAADAPGQTNLYLSNHSYGFATGWSGSTWYGTWGLPEADGFGQYSDSAALLDDIVHQAPYYLPVQAAGNDRDDNAPAAGATFFYYKNNQLRSAIYDPDQHPGGDGVVNDGYDTMLDTATAKNILTIGAVRDAVNGGQRWLGGAIMETYSNWGPTDDGRIKPDLVANGYNLYSCAMNHDSDYATMYGTSMAAPNACGSLALLQDLYALRRPGGALRASALKGLAIHTADDLGRPGPDYCFGWGLINTRAAADLLWAHLDGDAAVWLGDAALSSATGARTWEVTLNGANLFKATLAWSDPPGTATTDFDSTVSRLVNDLDLSLIAAGGGVEAHPFILDPAQPLANATAGDNTRDNVEQLPAQTPPAGIYRLRVSAKSAPLEPQIFSLLCSGQSAARLVTNDLAEAIDRPGETYTGGGDVAMHYQEAVVHDGFDAARSGAGLGHNQASWMESVVQGPLRISFWWRASSEANKDICAFLVGGVTQAAISGETDWQRRSFTLPPGTHTVRWQYAKDAQGSAGADALFVDQVEFAGAPGTIFMIE